MTPIILIADDHSMTRKGLKLLLEIELGYKEIYSATSCNEVMRTLKGKTCTHLVLDLNLSDGSSLEILPTIKNLYPLLKIMILSMQPACIYARALKKFDIYVFISKTAPEHETIGGLRGFFQNEHIAKVSSHQNNTTSPFSSLAAREMEILHYMLKGVGTNEIAKALNLKWNTISTVKNRIFEKTTTTNLIELKELATLFRIS